MPICKTAISCSCQRNRLPRSSDLFPRRQAGCTQIQSCTSPIFRRVRSNVMIERDLAADAAEGTPSLRLRDFLEIGFRQRRVIINSFLGIFSAAVLLAFHLPKKYAAQMQSPRRHERGESV